MGQYEISFKIITITFCRVASVISFILLCASFSMISYLAYRLPSDGQCQILCLERCSSWAELLWAQLLHDNTSTNRRTDLFQLTNQRILNWQLVNPYQSRTDKNLLNCDLQSLFVIRQSWSELAIGSGYRDSF